MKIQRKTFLAIAVVLLYLLVGSAVALAQGPRTRWDLVSVTAPGGKVTLAAGGATFGRASDGSTIRLTGSGTFGPKESDPVTGGGTWTINDASGMTTMGMYSVTGLVSFTEAPGTLPSAVDDKIGKNADARAGVAVLRIAYSDGSRGILVVSCHLPAGTPASVSEGTVATKDSELFELVSPLPGVDANRTVFHVAP